MLQLGRMNKKKREHNYDERIRQIEHGSLSPLVFSTSGGMGPTAQVVYKRIASMIPEKHDKTYSKTLHRQTLLCSAIMCIREKLWTWPVNEGRVPTYMHRQSHFEHTQPFVWHCTRVSFPFYMKKKMLSLLCTPSCTSLMVFMIINPTYPSSNSICICHNYYCIHTIGSYVYALLQSNLIDTQ